MSEVEWLVRTVVEIDNCEPPNRKPDAVIAPSALTIRATVDHALRHGFEEPDVRRDPPDDAGDSTH